MCHRRTTTPRTRAIQDHTSHVTSVETSVQRKGTDRIVRWTSTCSLPLHRKSSERTTAAFRTSISPFLQDIRLTITHTTAIHTTRDACHRSRHTTTHRTRHPSPCRGRTLTKRMITTTAVHRKSRVQVLHNLLLHLHHPSRTSPHRRRQTTHLSLRRHIHHASDRNSSTMAFSFRRCTTSPWRISHLQLSLPWNRQLTVSNPTSQYSTAG